MTSVTVFPLDEVERYDDLVDALASDRGVELRTSSGVTFDVSPELLTVIVEAAHYFARDKAVSVVPHSRSRFI